MYSRHWRTLARASLRSSTALTALSTLCVGSLLVASPAAADCDDNAPANGTTVTCDGPPIDLVGVQGDGDMVTVNVLTGASISVLNDNGIDLDDDAIVVMQSGTLINATGGGANGHGLELGDNADVTIAGTILSENEGIEIDNDGIVRLQDGANITGAGIQSTAILAGDRATIVTDAGSTISTTGQAFQGGGPTNNAIQVGDEAEITLGGDIFASGKASGVSAGDDLSLMLLEGATIQITDHPGGSLAGGAINAANGANITIAGSITTTGAAEGVSVGGANSSAANPIVVTVTGTGSIHTADAGAEGILLRRPAAPGGNPPPFIATLVVEDGGSVIADNAIAIAESATGLGDTLTSLLIAGQVETGVAGGTAVSLQTGDDRLELHSTFSIVGDVLGGDDTDSFVLGGTTDGSFDASLLDGDGVDEGEQFLEFETFIKEDSASWTLTGANDETFAWDVQNGGLFVTGMLDASSFDLSSGADAVVFGGNGTIGSFNAQDGATVSPGTLAGEIATLTVTNGLSFQNGSVFLVDLDGTPVNDAVAGTGVATINGGDVMVNVQPGGYENGEVFTIVDVDSLAGGTFDSVTDNAFLIEFVPLYDVAGGLVQLRADLTIESVAETPNEMGAATGIATADLGDPALGDLQALLPLIDTAEDTRLLLNGLSGEIYATNMLFSAQTGELFTQSIRHRGRVQGGGGGAMQSAQTGGAGNDLQLAAAALDTEASPFTQVAESGGMAEDGGVGLWGGFIGQVSSFDEDGNAADADHWVAGAAFGVETAWQASGLAGSVGLGLGYTRGGGDVGDGRGSDVESNGYHIGLYGSLASGPFALSAAASYAWIDSEVTRTLPFGLGETEGDVDSGVISTSLEASYGIEAAEGLLISPLAGFDATWVSQDGFDEDGAGPALAGDDADYSTYSTALGARLSGMLPMQGDDVAVWEIDAKWRHRFGDDTPSADLAFVAGSSPFEVYGPELGSDWAEVGAGLQYRSGVVSVGVRYDGDFGGSFSNHALSLTVGASF